MSKKEQVLTMLASEGGMDLDPQFIAKSIGCDHKLVRYYRLEFKNELLEKRIAELTAPKKRKPKATQEASDQALFPFLMEK